MGMLGESRSSLVPRHYQSQMHWNNPPCTASPTRGWGWGVGSSTRKFQTVKLSIPSPGLKELSISLGRNPGNLALLTVTVFGGERNFRTPNKDPAVKEAGSSGPRDFYTEAQRRVKDSVSPQADPWKSMGLPAIQVWETKPSSPVWGPQAEAAVMRSGKEPFSSCGLAKHPLPGLPACWLGTQPHTALYSCLSQGGSAPLHSRPYPWAVPPLGARGKGMGNKKWGRVQRGTGCELLQLPPCTIVVVKSLAVHLDLNWVDSGMDQKGTI